MHTHASSSSASNGAAAGSDSHAGYAVLHDFCMTLPYGTVALLVGVVSFFVGSAVLKSLAVPLAGVGAGTLALAVLSLKGWKQGKSSAPYTLLTAGKRSCLAAGLWQYCASQDDV